MESLGVSTVYDIYENVSIFEIIGPVRSQPTLSTDIPNIKLKNMINRSTWKNLCIIFNSERVRHTLNPWVFTDLILKPWVGVTCVMSSAESCFRMVVFPALSRPRSKILHSYEGSKSCYKIQVYLSSSYFDECKQIINGISIFFRRNSFSEIRDWHKGLVFFLIE